MVGIATLLTQREEVALPQQWEQEKEKKPLWSCRRGRQEREGGREGERERGREKEREREREGERKRGREREREREREKQRQ